MTSRAKRVRITVTNGNVPIRRYSFGDNHCAKLLLMKSCSEKAFAVVGENCRLGKRRLQQRPTKYAGVVEARAARGRKKDEDEEKVDEESTE